ncbi:UdgX family uracil-DNA binding protein [Allohahella marinimesophila]|uniref:Type-4 uracil-DNA glycosylase n=1 Tax=Allohahella marinimesophila TaxID=1054972 RepID=A0ABP7NNT3_9GAMM
MSSISTFEQWRERARELLNARVPPEAVNWEDSQQQSLWDSTPLMSDHESRARVPSRFMTVAQKVACHRSGDKWALLYRVLWRLVHGERDLLEFTIDPDVDELRKRAQVVHRAAHKMKAFLRFTPLGSVSPEALDLAEPADPRLARAHWAAWFEPLHLVLPLTAPFFARRFPNMHWSIFTPDGAAHHEGGHVSFVAGEPQSTVRAALERGEDAFESMWLTYYAKTFNPARTNTALMQSEMPKHYWKNMPEAALISALVSGSTQTVDAMLSADTLDAEALRKRSSSVRTKQDELRHKVSAREPLRITDTHNTAAIQDARSIEKLRELVQGCRACPLYERATQAVPGCGASNASLMIVGEQPGDKEDLQGEPFVGPAGNLLRDALEAVGLDLGECYLTNAVKHFKWKEGGKRRLHASPSAREVSACSGWLDAEMDLVNPSYILCLGATATKRVLGDKTRLLDVRGRWISHDGRQVFATVHPSYLLRLPEQGRQSAYKEFLADLERVKQAL